MTTTFILNHQSDSIMEIISKINKNIRLDDKETGTYLPHKLSDDNFIIFIRNINSNEIISFIWYGYYLNQELGKILHINYSYTFKKYRANGFNKFLRLELEKICRQNNIKYITSTPLEQSNSKTIMFGLGYDIGINYFYKKID